MKSILWLSDFRSKPDLAIKEIGSIRKKGILLESVFAGECF